MSTRSTPQMSAFIPDRAVQNDEISKSMPLIYARNELQPAVCRSADAGSNIYYFCANVMMNMIIAILFYFRLLKVVFDSY